MDNEIQREQGDRMRESSEKRRGISGSTLKIIALAVMLVDHTAAALLGRILIRKGYLSIMWNTDPAAVAAWQSEYGWLAGLYMIMRLVGRLGFPIFCFLLIEGFRYTRDRAKYALRLGCFALISEIPFDLAMKGEMLEFSYQNVFFTLFLGLLAMCAYEYFGSHEIPKGLQGAFLCTGLLLPALFVTLLCSNVMAQMFQWNTETWQLAVIFAGILVIWAVCLTLYGRKRGIERVRVLSGDLTALVLFMFLAELLRTDYASLGILTITMMYVFRRKPVKSMLAGCIVLTVGMINEFSAFLTLIPTARYNGKRGLKMKYVFYIFYPAHLLILYLAAMAMGMGEIPGL